MNTPPPPGLRALATDYDGTLAHNGAVSETTLAALQLFKESGHKLILVTGRELNELLAVFPEITLFDLAVVENGAVLYHPQTSVIETLAEPPPTEFVTRLVERGLPVQVGKTIVATWEPHENEVLQAIKDLGLALQVIFNKGAVMILPSGMNKASGLDAALAKLGLQPSQVAGVGDAENDHAFLDVCGWSVAVANALPTIKEKAHYVTTAERGEGVAEMINLILSAPTPAAAPSPMPNT